MLSPSHQNYIIKQAKVFMEQLLVTVSDKRKLLTCVNSLFDNNIYYAILSTPFYNAMLPPVQQARKYLTNPDLFFSLLNEIEPIETEVKPYITEIVCFFKSQLNQLVNNEFSIVNPPFEESQDKSLSVTVLKNEPTQKLFYLPQDKSSFEKKITETNSTKLEKALNISPAAVSQSLSPSAFEQNFPPISSICLPPQVMILQQPSVHKNGEEKSIKKQANGNSNDNHFQSSLSKRQDNSQIEVSFFKKLKIVQENTTLPSTQINTLTEQSIAELIVLSKYLTQWYLDQMTFLESKNDVNSLFCTRYLKRIKQFIAVFDKDNPQKITYEKANELLSTLAELIDNYLKMPNDHILKIKPSINIIDCFNKISDLLRTILPEANNLQQVKSHIQ